MPKHLLRYFFIFQRLISDGRYSGSVKYRRTVSMNKEKIVNNNARESDGRQK